MNKSKWSKAEILKMNVKTIPTVTKAMEEGYFSRRIIDKNKTNIVENDVVYAYSGQANAYVKLYKSTEAFDLYKNKKLQF